MLSEWLVARDRALSFNEQLVAHRAQTAFAEIDLITKANGITFLLEVKTFHGKFDDDLDLGWILPSKQRARLKRAREAIECRYSTLTELVLCVVQFTDHVADHVRARTSHVPWEIRYFIIDQ